MNLEQAREQIGWQRKKANRLLPNLSQEAIDTDNEEDPFFELDS